MNLKKTSPLFLAIFLLAACGKNGPTPEVLAARKVLADAKIRADAEQVQKTAITAQYNKAVAAIAANNQDTFKSVLDSDTQKDATKTNTTWALLRLLMGAANLKPEDLRVDAVTLNEEMNLALVATSHRENGEWKKDKKPQVWTTESGQWRWMP
jgi:hypothetical protein